MDLNEVKTFLEQNKDNEEVKTFVNGLNPVTMDRVKSLVNDDKDLKSWLDSEKDKHSSKSLETWKTNNLNKLIDDEIKKRFPEADPKDKELANLKAEMEKIKQEALRKDLSNKALKNLTEKKIPGDLVDFIVGNDEESTNKNLEKLAQIFAAHDEAIKTEYAKTNSYTPPGGKKDFEGKKAMEDEVAKYFK